VSIVDLGGTLRAVDPVSSLEAVLPLRQHFGITRLANVTGLDNVGVPTWMVVRPLARSLTVSQGKGLSDDLAKISGLMESIEIFHAEHLTLSARLESLSKALEDDAFISPDRLPICSDADFDSSDVIRWVQGDDLIAQKLKWIPEALFNLDFRWSRERKTPFLSSSNGLASGNTREEAILHGLCEVIERDQTSFWLVEQKTGRSRASTRVRLETIDNKSNRQLISQCQRSGLEIFVWYMTTTIEVPAFCCVIADEKNRTWYPQRASGFGCHPKKDIALSRAITEALQSRLTHISGVRDDAYWSRYTRDIRCDMTFNKEWLAKLRAEKEGWNYADIPECRSRASFREYVQDVLLGLAKSNLTNAICVDLTRSEFKIPVLFVCIPDAEMSARHNSYTPGQRMLRHLAAAGL
jgi:ribosomal protein S12 methylthiotransferase accessory factor